jgi:spermidine synthase
MGASSPPLDSDAGIAWAAVDTAWANFVGWEIQPGAIRAAPPDEQLRREALQRYVQDGDGAGARERWRRLSEPPRDPFELAMVADIEAETGSDAALPLIERLRAYQPAEADTLLAMLRLRQARIDEAAAALEAAGARYRVDPWPDMRFKERALVLALAIAVRDPAKAARLYETFRQPFAVRAIEDTRLLAELDLTTKFDFKGVCREPVGALEPHVPWTAAFLVRRLDCYQASGDARLASATRDLNEFLAREPLPLAPR